MVKIGEIREFRWYCGMKQSCQSELYLLKYPYERIEIHFNIHYATQKYPLVHGQLITTYTPSTMLLLCLFVCTRHISDHTAAHGGCFQNHKLWRYDSECSNMYILRPQCLPAIRYKNLFHNSGTWQIRSNLWPLCCDGRSLLDRDVVQKNLLTIDTWLGFEYSNRCTQRYTTLDEE